MRGRGRWEGNEEDEISLGSPVPSLEEVNILLMELVNKSFCYNWEPPDKVGLSKKEIY